MRNEAEREKIRLAIANVLEPFGIPECWVYGPYLMFIDSTGGDAGHDGTAPGRLDIGIRFGFAKNIFSTELDMIRTAISQQFNGIPVEVLVLTGAPYENCGADELAVYMTGFRVIGPENEREKPGVEDVLGALKSSANSVIVALESGAKSKNGTQNISRTLKNAGLVFERLSRSCTVLNAIFEMTASAESIQNKQNNPDASNRQLSDNIMT